MPFCTVDCSNNLSFFYLYILMSLECSKIHFNRASYRFYIQLAQNLFNYGILK